MAGENEDRSLGPSDFVQRIRKLGQDQELESTERNRALEDEILLGRSERLARRAGKSKLDFSSYVLLLI